MIKHAHARIHDICDISGEEYERQVEVKDFDARFASDTKEDQDQIYDDLFPLNPQSETINIYDFLVQSIKLQEPLVHIKPGKEHLLDDYESESEDDYEDLDETG